MSDYGVSVHHLNTDFLTKVLAAGFLVSSSIREVEPVVIRPESAYAICPRDGKIGAAYVDSLQGSDSKGVPGFMLSYTWSYSICDIADTLVKFCESGCRDLQHTYIWICCFCINQHRVQAAQARGEKVSFDDFQQAFGSHVSCTGHILAMMAPWRNPLYITRVWCNFEMFTALDMGCQVTILMPPRESDDLLGALMNDRGIDDVTQALTEVDVHNASASVEEDRMHILKLIENGPGFSQFNQVISSYLRQWVVQESVGHVKRCLQIPHMQDITLATLCANIGCFLVDSGGADDGIELLMESHKIRDALGILDTDDGAHLLVCIGEAHLVKNDLDAHRNALDQALAIRERTNTLETKYGAILLKFLGIQAGRDGDHVAEQNFFARASMIWEKLDGEDPIKARLLEAIGDAEASAGDHDKALQTFKKAYEVREATNTLGGPDAADLFSSMGFSEGKQGQHQVELQLYDEAFRIRNATHSMNTPAGRLLQTRMDDARALTMQHAPLVEIVEMEPVVCGCCPDSKQVCSAAIFTCQCPVNIFSLVRFKSL